MPLSCNNHEKEGLARPDAEEAEEVANRKMAKLYKATKVLDDGTPIEFIIPEDQVKAYRAAGFTITIPKGMNKLKLKGLEGLALTLRKLRR
jgi:hypothetical protein